MANTTINGLIAIAPYGSYPMVLVAQGDFPAISILDDLMLNNAPYLEYTTHVMALGDGSSLRPTRIKQYGRGTVTGGLIILNVDGVVREAWDATKALGVEKRVLLQQETSGTYYGTEFSVTYYLAGVGIELYETDLEYTPYSG